MRGATSERGSRNVEPEGAFRGSSLFAGLSVQPSSCTVRRPGVSRAQLQTTPARFWRAPRSQSLPSPRTFRAKRSPTTRDTFSYPLLGVGDYTVTVEAAGFKTSAKQRTFGCRSTNTANSISNSCPPSVSTNVEVNATEVAVQTTNPTLGQVITSEQVAELPLNGRDFVQLGHTDAGRNPGDEPQQLFQRRPQQRSIRARDVFAFGWRIARPEHGLATGRRRQ